ncbi:MAG: hypothetical protein V4722_22630 [Bacteroidota bacterium]
MPQKEGSLDGHFYAKYKVLQRVYGIYVKDTIELEAYDHYGIPLFSKTKNVMLFVSEYHGKFYHEKYQFYEVYKTKNDRWAGSYAEDYYGKLYNRNSTIQAEKIEFEEEVSYPTKILDNDGKEMKLSYPEPYFKIVGDKAIAIYGNYIEELFKLKRDGVLTARALFGNKTEEEQMIQQEIILEEVKPPIIIPLKKMNVSFRSFWHSLSTSIKTGKIKNFRKLALDSIKVCDKNVSIDTFFARYYNEIFDKQLTSQLTHRTISSFEKRDADTLYLPGFVKRNITEEVEIMVAKILIPDQKQWAVIFSIVKAKNGYQLYGCQSYLARECGKLEFF